MQKDKLAIEVFENRTLMGATAAVQVERRIKALMQEQPFVNIIFAAAPSQNEFLQALRASDVNWSRVRAFHMDEYIGLSRDAVQGFGNFLGHALFNEVPLAAVHYINGQAVGWQEECERYAALLKQYPPDIVCMGIGENGHIAFNDPPVADFRDPLRVKVVVLDAACRQQQVNDGCFSSLQAVPARAITLTIPALMTARYLYCMVPGKLKASAVFNTLHKKISEEVPASIIRTHPQATLYLDKLSSANL